MRRFLVVVESVLLLNRLFLGFTQQNFSLTKTPYRLVGPQGPQAYISVFVIPGDISLASYLKR